MFIDGAWVPAGGRRTIPVISPSTEEPIGEAVEATSGDVDEAVRAARRAFESGEWASTSLSQRAAVMHAVAERIRADAADIGDMVTSEMGQPISLSTALAGRAADTVDYIVSVAEQVDAVRLVEGPSAVVREPVGVVAAIAPWNTPFNNAIWKIVTPLMAGCTVVYKPAPETPLDVEFLTAAFVAAGLPSGVLNVVTGGGATGEALVSHPAVRKVAFTGSSAVGRRIGALAGGALKRVQLELGGKSAAIVLDDGDPEVVAAAVANGCFFNSGQVCAALSRVLVPRGRLDEFVDALRAVAGAWAPGDPFDPATTMGPLAGRRHLDRVLGYVADAVSGGAVVAHGGGRPAGLERGCYVEPTIITAVDNTSPLAQDEIFGPVVAVIKHDGDDHAVALANESVYGLHGAVFTGDADRALRVARRIDTGTISINAFVANTRAPFGGVKDSGIGREMGREGYESNFELKTINLSPGMEGLVGIAS